MTLAEYELVHSQRDRFAVLPGHQTDDIEYVVKQDTRYVVVDKRDAYEHLVELARSTARHDSRSSARCR